MNKAQHDQALEWLSQIELLFHPAKLTGKQNDAVQFLTEQVRRDVQAYEREREKQRDKARRRREDLRKRRAAAGI